MSISNSGELQQDSPYRYIHTYIHTLIAPTPTPPPPPPPPHYSITEGTTGEGGEGGEATVDTKPQGKVLIYITIDKSNEHLLFLSWDLIQDCHLSPRISWPQPHL